MVAFRTQGFAGLVPRTNERMLQPNQAQTAVNAILTTGAIKPRDSFKLVHLPVIANTIQSIFRLEKGIAETWLYWDKDVDVARSPIAGDLTRRFYYTGDFEPRQSNFDLATTGGPPFPFGKFVLGVNPPITAPTVTPTGGSGATVSRTYLYTYVTPLGEESKPSPASVVVSDKVDATWTVGNMDIAPPNTGTLLNAVKDTPVAGQVEVTLNDVFGLRAFEEIKFAGVVGMTDLDGSYEIISVDAANDKVVVAQVTTQTYLSAGTWDRGAPHNIVGMTKRIYRSVTTSTGTEFHFVDVVLVSAVSYNDILTELVVAAAETLQSLNWDMPPANAKGIVISANGIAACFFGNEVGLSEPFLPYAWPVSYRQSVEHDIVSIGYVSTTLTIMTNGVPYTITGVEPVTMGGGAEKMNVPWPCLSKRGVGSFSFGTAYPTAQGLVILGLQNEIVTRDLFTAIEWKELAPETFISSTSDNQYFFGYTVNGSSLMAVIDKREFAAFIKINQVITEAWTDELTDKLFVVIDNKIYHWEGEIGEKLSYSWKSKTFVLPKPVNLGACKVDVDFTQTEGETEAADAVLAAVIAANQLLIDNNQTDGAMADSALGEFEIGGDAMEELPSLMIDSLQFQLYAEEKGVEVVKFTKQVSNNVAFTLPSGYKSDKYAFAVSGNVKVTGVVLAENMQGLAQA